MPSPAAIRRRAISTLSTVVEPAPGVAYCAIQAANGWSRNSSVQPVAAQLLCRARAPGAIEVPRRGVQAEAQVEGVAHHEIGGQPVVGSDRDVGVALGEVHDGATRSELDGETGMLRRDQLRERSEELVEGRDHRHPDGALDLRARGAHGPPGRRHRRIHRLSRLECGPALGGDGELAPAAHDQDGAQGPLEGRQAAADGRGVDAEDPRGARNRAPAAEREQDPEVIPFGIPHPVPRWVGSHGGARVPSRSGPRGSPGSASRPTPSGSVAATSAG